MGDDNRIGTGDEWPEVDMNRQSYKRPATTASIGGDRFVVIPVNFNRWEEVEGLKTVDEPDTKKGKK